MASIEYLPPEVIQLQKELALHHPTLCRVLALVEDEAERFAMIATHVNVKVDGEYSKEQIAFIAGQLLPRLVEVRER